MKTDTQTLVGILHAATGRALSRHDRVQQETCPDRSSVEMDRSTLNAVATRLQELDGENTQLKLRIDQLEKKAAKVGA